MNRKLAKFSHFAKNRKNIRSLTKIDIIRAKIQTTPVQSDQRKMGVIITKINTEMKRKLSVNKNI